MQIGRNGAAGGQMGKRIRSYAVALAALLALNVGLMLWGLGTSRGTQDADAPVAEQGAEGQDAGDVLWPVASADEDAQGQEEAVQEVATASDLAADIGLVLDPPTFAEGDAERVAQAFSEWSSTRGIEPDGTKASYVVDGSTVYVGYRDANEWARLEKVDGYWRCETLTGKVAGVNATAEEAAAWQEAHPSGASGEASSQGQPASATTKGSSSSEGAGQPRETVTTTTTTEVTTTVTEEDPL